MTLTLVSQCRESGTSLPIKMCQIKSKQIDAFCKIICCKFRKTFFEAGVKSLQNANNGSFERSARAL